MKSIRLSSVCIISFLVISYSLYSLYKIIITTAPDFSVFYHSAINLFFHRNMYTDPNLYTGFSYPPVTALLYIPLTILPYQIAQAIFSIISYCLLYGVIYYCFRLFRIKLNLIKYLGAMSLSLLSFPVKFTLGMGQVNLIALFCLLFGLYTRSKAGSFAIALSIIVKPQLLAVLFVFLLFRKFEVFLRVCAWIIGIFFLEMICFGTVPWFQYVSNKIPELFSFTSQVGIYYNQGILAFAGRITQGTNMIVLYSIVSFILILTYVVLVKRKAKNTFLQSIALLFPLMLLIEPLSWQHHYVFLIPSFFWIVTQLKKKFILGIFVVLIYIGVSMNMPNAVVGNVILLSHMGLATCMLYGMMIWISWKKRYDV